jgi:hypothetical protein
VYGRVGNRSPPLAGGAAPNPHHPVMIGPRTGYPSVCMVRPSSRCKGTILSFALMALAPTPETPAADGSDPWSTVRGCLVVLDRFAGCSSDKAMAAFVERWIAGDKAADKAARKEIERRLRWWMRPVGRREQCAIWARRAGAPEHIGEASALAKSAATAAVSCEQYGRAIDKDAWIPAALIDVKQD